MSGLPRELIKWLQSLDLTHSFRNVRRDFSNGFLVAEIFSWYYPQQVEIQFFTNGESIETKQGNWSQLEKFFAKEKLNIPKEFINGTIHNKPGAAKALLESIYTLLTMKELRYVPNKSSPCDFSDCSYQTQLPLYARTTASQSVKTNLAGSEVVIEPDETTCTTKAESIIQRHKQYKEQEKKVFPERFKSKTSSKVQRLVTTSTQKPDMYPATVNEISVKQGTSPGITT